MNYALRIVAFVCVLTTFSLAGVTVYNPTSGSQDSSPVHFVASARGNYPIIAMKVCSDHSVVYSGTRQVAAGSTPASGARLLRDTSGTTSYWSSSAAATRPRLFRSRPTAIRATSIVASIPRTCFKNSRGSGLYQGTTSSRAATAVQDNGFNR